MEPGFDALLIHRMLTENFTRVLHQREQERAVLPFRKMARHGLSGDIVRRRELRARGGGAQHETVAVAKTRVQLAARRGIERRDCGDELVRFLVGDIVGAVVDHHGVLDVVGVRERHEIAAVRYILRRERDAHAGRFKRRSAGIIDLRIVAENGEVRRVAARGHAGRDSAREAELPLRREKVHARVPRKLERRMTAERGERLVSHTVAEKYHMLHIISPANFSRIRAFRLY